MKIKHRLMRDAMYRYAKNIDRPCTTEEMINHATLLDGTPIENAKCCSPKSVLHASSLIMRDPRFIACGLQTHGSRRMLWGVRDV